MFPTLTGGSAKSCLNWASVAGFKPSDYPQAGLEANYCRRPIANPDGSRGPWCFVGGVTKPVACSIPLAVSAFPAEVSSAMHNSDPQTVRYSMVERHIIGDMSVPPCSRTDVAFPAQCSVSSSDFEIDAVSGVFLSSCASLLLVICLWLPMNLCVPGTRSDQCPHASGA